MLVPKPKPEFKPAQLLPAVVAIAALCWTFHGVRWARVLEQCAELGALGFLLFLVPQVLALVFDTAGWSRAARVLGYRIRYKTLLLVRVGSEALATALPAGVVFAESAKIPLFVRRAGLTTSQAVATVAVRKYLVLSAQSAYLLVVSALAALALGFRPLALPAPAAWGPWLAVAAVVLAGAAFCVRCMLAHGQLARRVRSIAHRWFPRASGKADCQFASTDATLARFFQIGRAQEARITSWFLLGWLCESLETYVVLRLLGLELSFGAVAALEVTLALLRNAAFVVPGGIGIQDAGYALLLRALGVPDSVEVAAAVALLKRFKELLWMGLGLGILARERTRIAAA